MSIFNEEQIKAMFSREYICHECGHLMEFEDEWGRYTGMSPLRPQYRFR